jgi:hypothetical protein
LRGSDKSLVIVMWGVRGVVDVAVAVGVEVGGGGVPVGAGVEVGSGGVAVGVGVEVGAGLRVASGLEESVAPGGGRVGLAVGIPMLALPLGGGV